MAVTWSSVTGWNSPRVQRMPTPQLPPQCHGQRRYHGQSNQSVTSNESVSHIRMLLNERTMSTSPCRRSGQRERSVLIHILPRRPARFPPCRFPPSPRPHHHNRL